MSFAQEIKDFLGAAQAGQKIIGATTDEKYKAIKGKYTQAMTQTIENKNNDTETDELTKAGLRARNRNLDSATALSNERRGLVHDQRNDLAHPAVDPIYSGVGQRASMNPPLDAPVPTPAIGGPAAAPPVQPVTPDSGVDPTGQYSRGGAVKRYAEGGAVDDDASDDGDDDLPAPPPVQAVPTDTSVPTEDQEAAEKADAASGDTDFSSRGRGGAPQFSYAAARDAVKAGLTRGATDLDLHESAAVPTPGRQRAAHAWASGAHAAPLIDMDKIRDAVDHDHKLGESARNLAAIGAVYQYKMNQGDTDGAARAAFQMIQHYRVASQKWAVIAAHAGEQGNTDLAMHAAMKAYANVPDGQDFHVTKTADGNLAYSFTDSATGKVVTQGIEPPAALAASAMGFAQGGFDKTLLAAATQQPDQPEKPAVDPNAVPMKPADKKVALKQVDDAFTDPTTGSSKFVGADGKPKYTPDDETSLKGAVFRIANHTQNSRLTPEEATAAAVKIADPTIPDKDGFKPKPVAGGVEVTFGKHKVFVPQDDFDTLLAKRTAALKTKADKDKAAAEGSGYSVKGAVDGVTGAVGGALDWAKGDLAKWAKQNPEATARIKSAIDAGGRAAADAKAYLEKEMARPNIWKAIANGPGEGKI